MLSCAGMSEPILIGKRFAGPPGSGNGGYVCGRIAARVPGNPSSIRLIAPIPLERPLSVDQHPGGAVEVQSGQSVVARGWPTDLDVDVPALPDPREVEAAMSRYEGHARHPFPGCFVCGTARPSGDGLRLFTGPVDGRSLVAASWTPDAALANGEEQVDPVYVWSALDCPSGWAAGMLAGGANLVLGELTTHISRLPLVGEPCVALGWPLRRLDRKHLAGSALVSQDGEVLARAQAIWFSTGAAPRA